MVSLWFIFWSDLVAEIAAVVADADVLVLVAEHDEDAMDEVYVVVENQVVEELLVVVLRFT